MQNYRRSAQPLLPESTSAATPGEYNMYPTHHLQGGEIDRGFDRLAHQLSKHPRIVIDGFVGVLWNDFQSRLDASLHQHGIIARWVWVEGALHAPEAVDRLIEPFLGGGDPLFGKRFTGELRDFFDPNALAALDESPEANTVIFYGSGAALVTPDAYLIYLDVPKNEIQYRARAGSIRNLGAAQAFEPPVMYKRFYFIDWSTLNHHKAALLSKIDLFVDAQNPENPAFISGGALRGALVEISQTFYRVRPWFEPGPWGGQWMKTRFPGLVKEGIPNYAWSFEMIAPEQGLILESGGSMLEVSCDLLLYHDHHAILGQHAERFGFEFPIRFDFLDTFGGGNLSIQCHPRPAYIREHFGENFTQDETYYILDSKPDARVYIGFQKDSDPRQFRLQLEQSASEGTPVDIDRHVMSFPSEKHQLFLIPNGTIHASGIDNLVLEISATPYLFTFKMYDWLRLDLNGRPRTLNIQRALDNLRLDYRGERVNHELISRSYLLDGGQDWQLLHLPTHRSHFYDVHRLEFATSVTVHTAGSPHLLMLVEGSSIILETAGGKRGRFNFAETFIVPAAAETYQLINEGQTPVRVVKAFLKPDWIEPGE